MSTEWGPSERTKNLTDVTGEGYRVDPGGSTPLHGRVFDIYADACTGGVISLCPVRARALAADLLAFADEGETT